MSESFGDNAGYSQLLAFIEALKVASQVKSGQSPLFRAFRTEVLAALSRDRDPYYQKLQASLTSAANLVAEFACDLQSHAQPPEKAVRDYDHVFLVLRESGIEHEVAVQLTSELLNLSRLLPRYARRSSQSLGYGFESLIRSCLEARYRQMRSGFSLIWLEPELNAGLYEPWALEERYITRFQSLPSNSVKAWLELERRFALLNKIEAGKVDAAGHIIRYIESLDGRPRLVEIGATGYHRVAISRPKRKTVTESVGRTIRVFGHGLYLSLGAQSLSIRTRVVYKKGLKKQDLRLLERLLNVGDFAELTFDPEDRESLSATLKPIVEFMRARRAQHRTMRLIYVPSELEHPLGGVPEVGKKFLAEVLEDQHLIVSQLKIFAKDFDSAIYELLGADYIGIGVYVHNREEVRLLCNRLKEHNYQGRVILGGPEARTIDEFLTMFPDCDAVIRGEAEGSIGAVINVLESLDRGETEAAWELASTLNGCVFHTQQERWLCETRTRNKVSDIRCPLPFQWRHSFDQTTLKMNFTRGCPYLCVFCPNHQGRKFFAASADQMWQFSALAVADNLQLNRAISDPLIRHLKARFGVARDSEISLDLLVYAACYTFTGLDDWLEVFEALYRSSGMELSGLSELLSGSKWLEEDAFDGVFATFCGQIDQSGWSFTQNKRIWLLFKLLIVRETLIFGRSGWGRPGDCFTIETSEDNTLVNKRRVKEYLRLRRETGLDRYFQFNPGQNTVRDLMTRPREIDSEYLSELIHNNPFQVAFGTDGTSNAVLRQNRKPGYTIADVLAINAALARAGVTAVHNYILLTHETSFLQAIEALLLFYLLPLPWRDYGFSINLRVIKETTTLATDYSLILEPENNHWDVPMLDKRLENWLESQELSSRTTEQGLFEVFARELDADDEIRDYAQQCVAQWLDVDQPDPEIRALGQLLVEHVGTESLERLCWNDLARFREWLHVEATVDGRFCRVPSEILRIHV